MAIVNKDMPYGFRPVKHLSGAPYNGSTMRCYGKAGYGTALYIGDPCESDGTGCPRGCCPSLVLQAAADAAEIGMIIVSVEPNVNQPMTVHRPASTERYINCVVDPDVVYMIQGDSGGTVIGAITQVGSNAQYTQTANAASAALGLSCAELDVSDSSVDASANLWIMGIVNRENHNPLALHADYLVLINTHVIGCGSGQGAIGRVTGV